MPKKLEFYRTLAQDMIDADVELRKMQTQMDRMAHIDFQLPEKLRRLEWVRRYISTSPFEALRAATRVLSGYGPNLKVEPITVLNALEENTSPESETAREKANEWEKALKWQYSLSAKRLGMLLSDVNRSALLYDEICGMVIHMPTQLKRIEARGGNPKRYKAAMRFGDFAVIMLNPQTVHVRYSAYMTEAVLIASPMKPQAVVDFWGEKASAIKSKMDEDDAPDSYVVFHYQDYECETAWAVPGSDVTHTEYVAESPTDKKSVIVILEPQEPQDPFLHTICLRGGTTLDSGPENQRIPLLWPVWKADQWINANVAGTLQQSGAIAEFGKPKIAFSGPGSEEIDYDMTTPGGRIDLQPGHDVRELQANPLDPAMSELLDRREATINNATLARILVTQENQAGEAFASYSLRLNQAAGSLMPWKQLSERWLSMMFTTMLYWVHYTGGKIKGYSKDTETKGMLYEIDGEDIDPEKIYLEVELVADVPSDRLSKTTAAIQQARELKRPAVDILEEMGVMDPEQAIQRYYAEQFTNAAISGKLQLINMENSGEIQRMVEQRAQEMHQQMMASFEQMQPPPGGPGSAPPTGPQGFEGIPPEMAGALGGMPPNLMGGQGIPGVEGQGFNPGVGGAPPAMASPAMNTRETQLGQTRGGENTEMAL